MATGTATAKKTKARKRVLKAYRFDARLNQTQKLLLQRAADLEGRTMTDFVLHSAEVAAAKTIEERAMVIMTVRETESIVEMLLSPQEPGPVLRRAARHYTQTFGK